MSKTASVHHRKRKSFLRHFYVYFAYRHLFVNMAKNLDFSKSKGRPTNKNVSTSAVTRAEKIIISELVVVCQADLLKKASSHVIPSFVWRYFENCIISHQLRVELLSSIMNAPIAGWYTLRLLVTHVTLSAVTLNVICKTEMIDKARQCMHVNVCMCEKYLLSVKRKMLKSTNMQKSECLISLYQYVPEFNNLMSMSCNIEYCRLLKSGKL